MSNEYTLDNNAVGMSANPHSWYQPPTHEGEPIIFSTNGWQPEGWAVEEEDDHFEVYYHTNEVMRLSTDGMLSFSSRKGYVFQTREWAELCAKQLNRLDDAFGRGPSTLRLTSGNLGIGTLSPSRWLDAEKSAIFRLHSPTPPKPVLTIGRDGTVRHFDLPYFVKVWLRGTWVYAAWKRLMWGERGKL